MLGANLLMSSPQLACKMERGASTSIRLPRCANASITALVLPVPGSDVIRQRGWSRICSVVRTWCANASMPDPSLLVRILLLLNSVGKENDGVLAGPAIAASRASQRFAKLFRAYELIVVNLRVVVVCEVFE